MPLGKSPGWEAGLAWGAALRVSVIGQSLQWGSFGPVPLREGGGRECSVNFKAPCNFLSSSVQIQPKSDPNVESAGKEGRCLGNQASS